MQKPTSEMRRALRDAAPSQLRRTLFLSYALPMSELRCTLAELCRTLGWATLHLMSDLRRTLLSYVAP